MVWEEKHVIWAQSSWQLIIMSFLQSPGTRGQNMRRNSLKSSKNTVLFVNATIVFSENFFLVKLFSSQLFSI